MRRIDGRWTLCNPELWDQYAIWANILAQERDSPQMSLIFRFLYVPKGVR